MRKNHIAWKFILSKGYWVSYSQSLTANKNSGFSNKNTRRMTIRHCFVLPMTSPPTDSSLCAVENKMICDFWSYLLSLPKVPTVICKNPQLFTNHGLPHTNWQASARAMLWFLYLYIFNARSQIVTWLLLLWWSPFIHYSHISYLSSVWTF